ncbi:MAG: tetratricopeptide repeat protein [Polyangiaceae bacterium]|nr:tetratricopeptide repeat protein [Polyangiaceae bacterium]
MARARDESATDAAHWEAVEEATELLEEGRMEEALVALRDVIKASPSNPYAYFFLGQALFDLDQLAPARDAYRAALLISPDYLGARVGLSHALRRLGDIEGAIGQAKEALRRVPKDGDAMYAMGLAYAARGQRHLARKHLEGFLAAGPELEAAMEVRQILESLGLGEEGEPFREGDD